VILKNKGYAPGLASGRHGVNKVSRWLRNLLRCENLLLDHLHNLLVLLVVEGHHVCLQLVHYMHAMMVVQQFSIYAATTLKNKLI
jgi:hypothetical protein